jgi:predicted HTH transcriptional regulator
LVNSFLDSASVDSSNNRLVILLPIYCVLKQILSGFDLIVHNQLVNQISLMVFNGNPKSYRLSEIINNRPSEVITHHIQDDLIREGTEIRIYIDSLELELDKKEVLHISLRTIGLPKPVQYNNKEDVRIIIERDEDKYFERKPYLSYDPIYRSVNKGKEFDVMKTIDSFLNTEGGLLIIGVDDNKKVLGLDGDYSLLTGDRANFDKFQNKLRKLIRDTYFKNYIVEKLIEIKQNKIDEKDICLIEIRQSPVPIFVFHEHNGLLFYIRVGDSSIKLDRMELSDYLKRHFCTGSVFDMPSLDLMNIDNPDFS